MAQTQLHTFRRLKTAFHSYFCYPQILLSCFVNVSFFERSLVGTKLFLKLLLHFSDYRIKMVHSKVYTGWQKDILYGTQTSNCCCKCSFLKIHHFDSCFSQKSMQMMAHPIQMSFAINFCSIFVIYKYVTALQNHFNILLILLALILKFLIDKHY